MPSGVALPSSGDHDAAVVSVRAGGCVGYGYGLVDRVGVLPSGNREGLRRLPLRGGGGPAGRLMLTALTFLTGSLTHWSSAGCAGQRFR